MKKRNITLHIDTAKREETIVSLKVDEEMFVSTASRSNHTAQSVLPMIIALLASHSLTWRDVTHVVVNPGPGSFTGLRVGVAIANTIGWLLNIPVNGKKSNIVKPTYETPQV